ncbi:hypothetical protein PanNE5_27410 [Pandoraea sp. NE5]|nr:hypothetical protein PanNE5_27410 [Pandoraea sp. NE5]
MRATFASKASRSSSKDGVATWASESPTRATGGTARRPEEALEESEEAEEAEAVLSESGITIL